MCLIIHFYHISFEPFSNLLSWPSSYMNGAQSSECIISPGKQFMSRFLDPALTFWLGKHLSFIWLFWRHSKGFWCQGSMNTFGDPWIPWPLVLHLPLPVIGQSLPLLSECTENSQAEVGLSWASRRSSRAGMSWVSHHQSLLSAI